MAPMNAKLIADFSSVPAEADKAVAALGRMDVAGVKVEGTFNRIKAPAAIPETGQAITALSRSLGQFDNVLGAVGVHIGPEIRALTELGTAATNGAEGIGALGVAGLAMGAGIAGWGIGRAISDFFGLDKAIGDATAKLLGWGDVAAMSAAARADVLAKASATAGHAITNLAEAMGINQAAAQDAADAAKEYSDSMDRVNASALNAQDLAKWNAEIETLKNEGVLPDLTADLNSHNFSLKTLADRYKISAEALALWAKEAAESARIEESNSKKMAAARMAEAESIATLQDRKDKAAAADKKRIYDEVDAITAADKAHHDLGVAADEEQAKVKKKAEEATAALKKEEEAAKALARAMGNTLEFDLSTAAGRSEFKRLNPGATVNASDQYFQTHSLADAVRDGLVNFYSHYATQGGAGSPSLVAPGTAARGAGGTNTVNVTVSGVFDPKAKQALSGAVGTALANAVQTGRAA
jgi:hypothetical protein